MHGTFDRTKRGKTTIAAELLPLLLVAGLALLAFGMWIWRSSSLQTGTLQRVALAKAPLQPKTPTQKPRPVEPAGLEVPPLPASAIAEGWRMRDGEAVLLRPDGSSLALTIEPALQERIEARLQRSKVPYAAVVALDPKTGAVLAMAEKRQAESWIGEHHGILRANAPAASVFKVITAAALLEAGVAPDRAVRYHGGSRGIEAHHLEPSHRDNAEATLSEALARSINPIFARLAVQQLTAGGLAATAEDFRFGRPLPFDLPVAPSRLEIDAGALALGRVAAGFEGSHLSPLHAALLAATVANDGVMMRPYVVATDSLQPGKTRRPAPLAKVLQPKQAEALRQMMVGTVQAGSATRQFQPWPDRFSHVAVAGKTGTLDVRGEQFAGYTWFVGFAPADDPKIAIAALAVNERGWWVRGPTLARHALLSYLELHPEIGAPAPADQPEAEANPETSSRPQTQDEKTSASVPRGA